MLILDEHNKTHIIDNINVPLAIDYFWILDLNILDFTLSPLLTLEEIVSPAMTIVVAGFEFTVPANWSILIYDEDTTALDVVEVSNLAGRNFTAFVYGHDMSRPFPGPITVIDYTPQFKSISPVLNKNQMLCHPISPDEWICVSPGDVYNKYLRDLSVGDLIS
jgi:hypothetical protein